MSAPTIGCIADDYTGGTAAGHEAKRLEGQYR
jgi:hypothetical protein